MNDLNEVIEFLVQTTYKRLKMRTGRTPGFSKVILTIRTIVFNNYEDCLSKFTETEEYDKITE